MARPIRIHERGSDNPVFAETSLDMAKLSNDDPRMYSIADLGVHNRRRWRALSDLHEHSLVEDMFAAHFEHYGDARYATYLVTSQFVHSVLGRSVASFVHKGRVWDPYFTNFYVRTNQEWGFDWVGVDDSTMRVLPDDRFADSDLSRAEMVILPGESERAYWLAGRAASSLEPVFRSLSRLSHCTIGQMWSTTAREASYTAVIAARFGGTCREEAERRVQLVLGALEHAGHPVRKSRPLPSTLMDGNTRRPRP